MRRSNPVQQWRFFHTGSLNFTQKWLNRAKTGAPHGTKKCFPRLGRSVPWVCCTLKTLYSGLGNFFVVPFSVQHPIFALLSHFWVKIRAPVRPNLYSWTGFDLFIIYRVKFWWVSFFTSSCPSRSRVSPIWRFGRNLTFKNFVGAVQQVAAKSSSNIEQKNLKVGVGGMQLVHDYKLHPYVKQLLQ